MQLTGRLPIRVLTHNIRYATKNPGKGEEKWDIRKSRLINELCYNTAYYPNAFICLQEVLHEQLLDILSGLNRKGEEWDYVGVGREDGLEAGEYSPILYQPGVWKLVSSKTVWLSETPDRPSKGWDAACTRILTLGLFQHRHSNQTLGAMNTHLDHQGSRSRFEAAKLLLAYVAKAGNLPVFLAGDFNSERGQEAYETINSEGSPMCDVQDLVSECNRYGHRDTFTGFGDDDSQHGRIDFLFINNNNNNHARASLEANADAKEASKWSVEGYAVLANRFDDGIYCSDHRAVVGDLLIN